MSSHSYEYRDVFLSFHEKTTGSLARKIAEELQEAGISVWFSPQIRTGADWLKWIQHGISHCRVFVALLDAGSVKSSYMKREAVLAEERSSGGEIDMLGYQFPNLPRDGEDNWPNLLFKTAQKLKLAGTETPERIAEIVVQDVMERLPLPDCRVAFLGNPGAGKTALIARLSGTIPEGQEGIHEILWKPEVKGQSIHLRCVNMNFNEKETNRELYRCFLTPDTVYVLVWDGTLINNSVDSETPIKIKEWLETLNREVPACPVLLVLSKADQCEHELEGLDGSLFGLNGSSLKKVNGALQKREGGSCYFWSFSHKRLIRRLYEKQQECDACANERNREKFAKAKKERDKAVARLMEAERERKELIRRIVAEARRIRNGAADTGKSAPPEKRAQLEDSLRQTRLCRLSAQRYAEACAAIGVHEPEERDHMLAYLRSIGAVWHDGRQTDSVFRMDSPWLANKINDLMDEAGNGFLPRSYDEEKRKLREAANGYDDPCQAAEFVFQIMQYYNLAFLLNHKDGKKALVPYRLLDTPPDNWKLKLADMEQSALHLRCEGIAVSPVALCQLMLELSRLGNLSHSFVWKYGFLLRQRDGECQALISTRISALYAVKTDGNVLFDASADSHVSDADDTDDTVMDVYVKGREGQWPAGQWPFWTAIYNAIQPIVEEYSRGQWKIILYCRRKSLEKNKRSNAPEVLYVRCRPNDGHDPDAVVKCEIDYEEARHLEELRASARPSTQEAASRFFSNLLPLPSANYKEKSPKRISVHALNKNMPDGSMDLEQIFA